MCGLIITNKEKPSLNQESINRLMLRGPDGISEHSFCGITFIINW
jgi:hypothetical protein